ncbi:MAG TPA: bifunctional phosphoribosylaminoimidazolecarboxamide formyltransferase/IMP cyclohydrolase [Acidobacteriaceae bacterium]|nr:bifunctional phosphoribosylaminoimidazolecarboxamide formyltransferase/IMP cyclohydrolase [Acidobacteriaceae bacterium]
MTKSATENAADGGLRKIRRALLSVTDKTGLKEFAQALAGHGVELVSTGGTAKALREAGLTVRDISGLTGFPEMLDGRVKTLHPKVHGGILHMRGNAEHVAAVKEHAIEPIDMVVVNLYAFEKTASRPGVAFSDVIENIDIGGPSMVRSAAKNFEDVAIVTAVADYAAIAEEMAANGGAVGRATRWRLAKAAFATTAAYDSGIATALESIAEPQPHGVPAVFDKGAMPETLRVVEPRKMVLRYGENPHQSAALYVDGTGRGIAGARQLQGKELSYNNLVDLDACWELASEFGETAVAIIKHTNPCGAATGGTVLEAYKRALEADPVSAFGGVIGINREVDGAAAEEIAKLFVEAIVAPGFTPEAVERFAAKKNLRLLEIAAGSAGDRVIKQISGGFLVQDADRHELSDAELKVVTKRAPTAEEMRALKFAWTVCKHVKSNAILYARYNDGHGQTVGVGAGQMSRVDAARFGAMKAVLPLAGTVAASDAFFPFPDGLEAVANAGATAVIQPGGSVRDAEVIEAADRLGVAMVLTGVRHFRHG